MNGLRVSVCVPGADAGTLVDLAHLAETYGVGVWAGDLTGTAANADDSYVLAAAAGMVATTTTTRVGVILGLRGTASPLRLAEDVGVVDQASGGRIEIALVPHADTTWDGDVERLFGAWTSWPTVDGRTVAAAPGPAQPWVPRLVVGGIEHAQRAARLRAGLLVPPDATAVETAPDDTPVRPGGRVVAGVGIDGAAGVHAWLADDPLGRVLAARATADAAGADELLFVLPDAPRGRLVSDVRALGTVVGPSTRCAAHHVEFLATDSWRWLTELSHLHHAPGEA